MTVCSRNHDEIVYEEDHCPMCDMIADHIADVKELEDEIKELRLMLKFEALE